MPHVIQQEGDLLVVTYTVSITAGELVECARELAARESSFPATPSRLTDLSAVTELHLDFESIDRFRRLRREATVTHRIKSAIVAPRDIQFGFARMFQSLGGHPLIVVEVFRDEAAARAWLAEPLPPAAG